MRPYLRIRALSKGRRAKTTLGILFLMLGGVLFAGKRQADRLETEAIVLAETGRAVIHLLNAYAAGIKHGDAESVADCYAGPRAGEGERFRHELLSERDGVRVYTWQATRDSTGPSRGQELETFVAGLGSIEVSKFKLGRFHRIEGHQAQADAVLWLKGRRPGSERFEVQARFRLDLIFTQGDDGWKIDAQRLLSGETVTGAGTGFADVTRESGVDFVAARNPLFETPDWELKAFGILKFGSAGVSAADYDGDGWYDLFFADGVRARLYRNNGDGTFRDVTRAAGLADPLPCINVGIFADLDNDGDKDLFAGCYTDQNRLYRNEGDGTFTDVTESAGLGGKFATVAAAGDYDNDGLLDLYVGRYLDARVDLPTTLFYTRNGQGNRLYRNLGQLRFADVTQTAGVAEGGLTLGVAWADYDQDGDQDLYVANDFGRNALLSNDGDGTFTDVSEATGTFDVGFGMSVSSGDVDNDGDLDLYVSNVHSGQRWYGQATTLYQYLLTSLREGTALEDAPLYWEIFNLLGPDWHSLGDRMVKGNSLLLNDGRGKFREVAEAVRANPFGWYWGSTFLDFDNDGRLDIYANNGWISGKSHDDL